jgi:dipeptidyl aminopeptidase
MLNVKSQDIRVVKGPLHGYLDIVPNEGFNHIAFFSPVNSTEPTWITSGEWEVTQISGVDDKKGLVYVRLPFTNLHHR